MYLNIGAARLYRITPPHAPNCVVILISKVKTAYWTNYSLLNFKEHTAWLVTFLINTLISLIQ